MGHRRRQGTDTEEDDEKGLVKKNKGDEEENGKGEGKGSKKGKRGKMPQKKKFKMDTVGEEADEEAVVVNAKAKPKKLLNRKSKVPKDVKQNFSDEGIIEENKEEGM